MRTLPSFWKRSMLLQVRATHAAHADVADDELAVGAGLAVRADHAGAGDLERAPAASAAGAEELPAGKTVCFHGMRWSRVRMMGSGISGLVVRRKSLISRAAWAARSSGFRPRRKVLKPNGVGAN